MPRQFRIINTTKGLLEISPAELQEVNSDASLVERSPVHPLEPIQGQIYFNTTENTFYGFTGAIWVDLGGQYSDTWLGLLDTPNAYTGNELNQVIVSEDGTKLEFIPRNFIFNQGTPSAQWIINHPLKKKPSVTTTTSAGDKVEGHVRYIGTDTVIVTFNAAFSGTAILN